MTLARKIAPTGIIAERTAEQPEITQAERVAARRRALRVGRSDTPTDEYVRTEDLAAAYGYTPVRIRQIMLAAGCEGWRQKIEGRSLRVYPYARANFILTRHCEERRIPKPWGRPMPDVDSMAPEPLPAHLVSIQELAKRYGLCFNGVARVLTAAGVDRVLGRIRKGWTVRAYDRARATEIMERHVAARRRNDD